MAPKKANVVEGQVGFDDLDESLAVQPKARSPRGRKVATSDLDLGKRPQTRLKLLSLDKYLPVWFGKISNRTERDAYYLDLFAGAGVYPDGITTAKGSPVLACEAAIGAMELQAQRGRTWTPHLRFVEEDEDATATLGAELGPYVGKVDFQVINSTAAAALPALLAESAGSPTLAFFDPWGYSGVTFDMVAAFARQGLNEALVSFETQAVVRNVAANQPDGLTAFSGGDWWKELVTGKSIDLDAYLVGLCRIYRTRFSYAGVERFRFPDKHAFRAVLQVCGSIIGRKAWMESTTKARKSMGLLSEMFEDSDRQSLCDQIINRWSKLAGRDMTFRDAAAELSDLVWDQATLDQVMAFLADRGLLTWEDKTAHAGYGYRWMRFSRSWSAGVCWDGVERAAPARPARTPVPSAH